jgi:hypothetical protein
VSESRARDAAAGQAGTHPLSLEGKAQSAAHIAGVLESICGHPLWPNDPTPGQILADGARQGVPALALCRFLQDKAAEFRARAYPITSPGLFVAATRTDLIAWARTNHNIITGAIRDAERAIHRAEQAAATYQLPNPTQEETHDAPDASQDDVQPAPRARTAGGA